MLGKLQTVSREIAMGAVSGPKGKIGVPLSHVVTDCVNRWSEGFLELAKNEDIDAMAIVAQMHFKKEGWGKVRYNQHKGMSLLENSARKGSLAAKGMLENIKNNPKLIEARSRSATPDRNSSNHIRRSYTRNSSESPSPPRPRPDRDNGPQRQMHSVINNHHHDPSSISIHEHKQINNQNNNNQNNNNQNNNNQNNNNDDDVVVSQFSRVFANMRMLSDRMKQYESKAMEDSGYVSDKDK